VDERVWAIVSCGDRCACKELEKVEITYEKTVIATDLGFVRDVKLDVRFDEIDRLADMISPRV